MTTTRRAQLLTFDQLLNSQRELAPRCPHCGDAAVRDHELLQAALQTRIRILEAQLADLEAQLTEH